MKIGALCATACAVAALAQSAALAADGNWFREGHFDVTSGRVGYHLVSWLVWNFDDIPSECRSDGAVHVHEADVEGTLPPGLVADPPNNFKTIEGTPKQPGDWSYAVTLHDVVCNGAHYGDRRLDVNFHVDP